MKWFEGGIPQAIQAAKNNKSVFIVFVSGGDDEASKHMEEYLHQKECTDLCETNRCVAVKLLSDSNDCKFFSQIFPVVVVPSTFFIGDTGTPLEVIGEAKSAQDFMAKVQTVISSHKGGQTVQEEVMKSEQSGDLAAAASSDAASSSPTEGAQGGTTAVVNEGNGDEASADKPQEMELDDKVERAKELIRMKQEQKREEEAETARNKEQERRKVGQGVQKLRQDQKEQDMLEAKKELKKDREDDKIARQRVKEQIARDRAEKNARYNEAKAERDKETQEAKKRKLLEQQAAADAEAARRSDIARIQFRLPDGSSVTQQFDATDTFAAVFTFITGQMGCAVTLSMAFPRRNFTEADHGSTLQELSLAPTAVILVIPGNRNRSPISSSGGGLAITNIILSPFLFLWNILSSLLGWSSSPSSSSSSAPSSGSTAAAPAQSSGSPRNLNRSASGGDRDQGSARKRDASGASRQQGAVHKFHNAEDDEDDEDRATWNGNSTQQM